MLNTSLTYIVSDILNISPSSIMPHSKLLEDLGVDSLSLAEISIEIERELNINISEEDLVACETINEIANLITGEVENRDIKK